MVERLQTPDWVETPRDELIYGSFLFFSAFESELNRIFMSYPLLDELDSDTVNIDKLSTRTKLDRSILESYTFFALQLEVNFSEEFKSQMENVYQKSITIDPRQRWQKRFFLLKQCSVLQDFVKNIYNFRSGNINKLIELNTPLEVSEL